MTHVPYIYDQGALRQVSAQITETHNCISRAFKCVGQNKRQSYRPNDPTSVHSPAFLIRLYTRILSFLSSSTAKKRARTTPCSTTTVVVPPVLTFYQSRSFSPEYNTLWRRRLNIAHLIFHISLIVLIRNERMLISQTHCHT